MQPKSKKVPYVARHYLIPAISLYKGLMMDLFNPKHAAKAYEIECTLCFDW